MVPFWVRILHWILAALFLVLIFTGITQHFATEQSSLMDYSIATTLHEVAGIALSIVYVLFMIGLFSTGYWRKYVSYKKLWRQLLWQLTQFHGRNPATIFLVMPLLVITGLLYYFPDYAPEKVLGFDGLWTVANAHYIAAILATTYTLGIPGIPYGRYAQDDPWNHKSHTFQYLRNRGVIVLYGTCPEYRETASADSAL